MINLKDSLETMTNFYILKDKVPVPVSDVEEWGRWFETGDRRVGKKILLNGYFVSTIFLGLSFDKQFFESMVFPNFPKFENPITEQRYQTWDQAYEGHQALINEYQMKFSLKDSPRYLWTILTHYIPTILHILWIVTSSTIRAIYRDVKEKSRMAVRDSVHKIKLLMTSTKNKIIKDKKI